jgi:hypothetical protein
MIIQTLRAFAFISVFALPTLSHAVPIVTAGSATVNVGDIFTIPISITDAVDLTSFQLDMSFTASILQVTATGITESAFFTQGDSTVFVPGILDNTNGQILGVSDAFAGLQPPVNGSGVLANIEFQAMAAGVSPLTLSNVFLNLLDSGFTVTNGEVCVKSPTAATCGPGGQVPEPSTLVLLSLGIGAFWLRGRLARRMTA